MPASADSVPLATIMAMPTTEIANNTKIDNRSATPASCCLLMRCAERFMVSPFARSLLIRIHAVTTSVQGDHPEPLRLHVWLLNQNDQRNLHLADVVG